MNIPISSAGRLGLPFLFIGVLPLPRVNKGNRGNRAIRAYGSSGKGLAAFNMHKQILRPILICPKCHFPREQ